MRLVGRFGIVSSKMDGDCLRDTLQEKWTRVSAHQFIAQSFHQRIQSNGNYSSHWCGEPMTRRPSFPYVRPSWLLPACVLRGNRRSLLQRSAVSILGLCISCHFQFQLLHHVPRPFIAHRAVFAGVGQNLCPKCGSEMKVIAFIERDQSEVIERILRSRDCGWTLEEEAPAVLFGALPASCWRKGEATAQDATTTDRTASRHAPCQRDAGSTLWMPGLLLQSLNPWLQEGDERRSEAAFPCLKTSELARSSRP